MKTEEALRMLRSIFVNHSHPHGYLTFCGCSQAKQNYKVDADDFWAMALQPHAMVEPHESVVHKYSQRIPE